MFHRSGLARTTRSLVVGATMCAALFVSVGLDAPNSSALGTSAFCKTLFTYNTTKEIPPTSFADYPKWAAALLPFYEKLAAEAPTAAARTTLSYVVSILKYESTHSSLTSLETYFASHRTKFEAGTEAVAKAIRACA